MPEEEEKRVKKKKKKTKIVFKSPFKPSAATIKKRERASKKKQEEKQQPSASGGTEAKDPPPKRTKKKKKTTKNGGGGGFGSRIRGLVKGRTKKSKKDNDEMDNSIYQQDYDPHDHPIEDYDPHNPPIEDAAEFEKRQTSLDPDVMAEVLEVEDESDDGDRQYEEDLRAQRMMSKDVREIPQDQMIDDMEEMEQQQQQYREEKKKKKKKKKKQEQLQPTGFAKHEDMEMGDLMGGISLVLLLVDPDTLRFELLQLEFEHPREASVNDVLSQIEESVTEPAIRKLQFHAVADRTGGRHERKDPLMNALTKCRGNRDILVAMSQGIDLERCSQLARPILGDEKVIGMVCTVYEGQFCEIFDSVDTKD